MFQPVSNSVDFPAQEREILAFWQRTGAFERLKQLRSNAAQKWSFIDGPITANNPMGVHHAWGRTYKDLFNRFHAMQGKELRYQQGFDCQGLWVEVNVEKALGFNNKRDIVKMGLDKFTNACKQRVLDNAATQTDQSIRLGYWMNWNDTDELRMLARELAANPEKVISVQREGEEMRGTVEQLVGQLGNELGGSYFTFSNENNYLIWTFIKECFDNGWLYRGTDSIPWCARCGTAISQHEIDTEGYKDISDNSITVRFKLLTHELAAATAFASDETRAMFDATPNKYLLAWTTTPWTLPANVMAAVGAKLSYSVVQQVHADGEAAIYVLSSGTIKMLRGEYVLLGTLTGASMDAWTYAGLFDDLDAWQNANETWGSENVRDDEAGTRPIFAHRVILWDEVGDAEGTGIVHIAPGCGAEDHALGKQFNSPMVAPIDEFGNYVDGFGPLTGKFAHDVSDEVERLLKTRGVFYKREKYTHRYPHCWRCSSKLLYRVVDEWYIGMDGARGPVKPGKPGDSLRERMKLANETINWVPTFGKDREREWLTNMHDWMISKKRFYGLALPIWEYPDGSFEVIGSHAELRARAVEGWEKFEGHTPHRPWIDHVKIRHPETGLIGTRIPDVGNPWLDAGIVGLSTLGFRTNPEYWKQWFPGHFMVESFPGQFRNWFYAMIAMSAALTGQRPADTIMGFATLMDGKGQPMHKSSGNSIEFNEAAEKAGADMMRWLYARQKMDDNLRFGFEALSDVRKDFFIPLWNVYSFFVTYANIDKWTPASPAGKQNNLDRWILARQADVTATVETALHAFDSRSAALALEGFVDDLSNWYVRRSRERFWDGDTASPDKQAAHGTLYAVLSTLCKLIAPIAPFTAEAMWQNLSGNSDGAQQGAFSVHHQLFPAARPLAADEQLLLRDVATARTTVNLGHSLRAQSKLKTRQPLAKIVVVANEVQRTAIIAQQAMIAGELNIKAVTFAPREQELVTYKILPDLKKLGKKLGQQLPAVRDALATADSGEIALAVRAGKSVMVAGVELAADELIVQAQPKDGMLVEGADGIVVALDTQLNEALIHEGLAREVIRRVNDLRKSAGLQLSDRIALTYTASTRLDGAIKTFRGFIAEETLSHSVIQTEPIGALLNDAFDGETLHIGISKL